MSRPGKSSLPGPAICSAGLGRDRCRCGSIVPMLWPMPPRRTLPSKGGRPREKSCLSPEWASAGSLFGRGDGGGIDLLQRPPRRGRDLIVELLIHHLLEAGDSSLGCRSNLEEGYCRGKADGRRWVVQRFDQGRDGRRGGRAHSCDLVGGRIAGLRRGGLEIDDPLAQSPAVGDRLLGFDRLGLG